MKVIALLAIATKANVSLQTVKRAAQESGVEVSRHYNPANQQQMLTLAASDYDKVYAVISEFDMIRKDEITIVDAAKQLGCSVTGLVKHLKKHGIKYSVKRTHSGQRAKVMRSSHMDKIQIGKATTAVTFIAA